MPTRAILPAVLALASLTLTGCSAARWAMFAASPDPKTEAQVTLPADQTVLVFPDDWHAPLAYPPLKQMLADRLSHQLVRHASVARTVPYSHLLNLQARSRDFAQMSIPAVGRELDADWVVYVEITHFRLKEDIHNPLWQPRLVAMVKVIDVAQGRRVWPGTGGAEGHELIVEIPPHESASDRHAQSMAEHLAQQMAQQIGRLFYTYKVDPFAGP